MKTLKVPTTIRDAESGEIKETKTTDFMILPAPADTCPECARKHEPDQPHDRDSLHYQYAFYANHNRWPTWSDAMAHCSEKIQALWKNALEKRGIHLDK